MGKGYILPKSYRKLGIGFFLASILSTTFIGYLVWAKVVILISPNTQTINSEFIFSVKPDGDVDNGVVSGLVKTIEVEGSDTYQATGSKETDSNLVGEVTIINNFNKDQALIRTTRLAYANAPDTVIVRLDKDVVVPAGGSVKVQVYPDNQENFKTVEEGDKLIIPGLWGPIQDKIFAQVDVPLSKGAYKVSVVTQEDLDKASASLREQLYQKALTDINEQLEAKQKLWPKLVEPDISEVEYSATLGEEISEFTTKLKLKVVVVIFDEDQVITLAQNRLKDSLPAGKQLIGLSPESFTYSVGDYNIGSGQASINAVIAVDSILTGNAGIFDKSKIVGLSEEGVKSYFSQFSEVNSIEIEFHPSWLKKIPRFKDKIEIRIVN